MAKQEIIHVKSLPAMGTNGFAQYNIPANGVLTLTAISTVRFLLITNGANASANGVYIVTMAPNFTTSLSTLLNATGIALTRESGKLIFTNSIADVNYANLICLGAYNPALSLTAS